MAELFACPECGSKIDLEKRTLTESSGTAARIAQLESELRAALEATRAKDTEYQALKESMDATTSRLRVCEESLRDAKKREKDSRGREIVIG